MKKVFGAEYSDLYDVFYQDKGYNVECDLVERIFREHGGDAVGTILDLGCGTGRHALALAERGYRVAGVDRSENMLAQAKEKARERSLGTKVTWRQGDIRDLDMRAKFDAVLMMFAVLGYQHTNADVLAALSVARKHLSAGGLLIFDVWYGPAVLNQKPEQRVRMLDTEQGRIVRFASSELDTGNHICQVHYDIWRFEGNTLASETEETHALRYFFPLELQLFLQNTGFSMIELKDFPGFNHEPDETTWNTWCVAKAVEADIL